MDGLLAIVKNEHDSLKENDKNSMKVRGEISIKFWKKNLVVDQERERRHVPFCGSPSRTDTEDWVQLEEGTDFLKFECYKKYHILSFFYFFYNRRLDHYNLVI